MNEQRPSNQCADPVDRIQRIIDDSEGDKLTRIAAVLGVTAEPCAATFQPVIDGPIVPCTLPSGHEGKHLAPTPLAYDDLEKRMRDAFRHGTTKNYQSMGYELQALRMALGFTGPNAVDPPCTSEPPPAGPPFSVRWAIGQLLDELPQRRDWLNPDVEKILREHIRPAPTKEGLCPHGMPLAENVCGPCSQGRPNRPPHEKEARRQRFEDAAFNLGVMRTELPDETSACRHLRRVGMATPEGKIIREQCEDCGVQLSNT